MGSTAVFVEKKHHGYCGTNELAIEEAQHPLTEQSADRPLLWRHGIERGLLPLNWLKCEDDMRQTAM